MTQLRILRGVPASGKSTYAAEYRDDGWAVVNRDDLRMALFGRYVDVDEEVITAAEDAAIRANLSAGFDTIVDATNLNNRFVQQKLQIAAEYGASVTYRDFTVSLEEAVRRDAGRVRSVGRQVITRFFTRYHVDQETGALRRPPANEFQYAPYAPDETKPGAYLVDTDGTVALMSGRSPYDTSRYHTDIPNTPVIQAVSALSASGFQIIGLSGRDEAFREVTETWWLNHVGFVPPLFLMRPEGDQRNDALVKYELFRDNVRDNYNVQGVFDDRPRVLRMWRAVGIPTFQIGTGREF